MNLHCCLDIITSATIAKLLILRTISHSYCTVPYYIISFLFRLRQHQLCPQHVDLLSGRQHLDVRHQRIPRLLGARYHGSQREWLPPGRRERGSRDNLQVGKRAAKYHASFQLRVHPYLSYDLACNFLQYMIIYTCRPRALSFFDPIHYSSPLTIALPLRSIHQIFSFSPFRYSAEMNTFTQLNAKTSMDRYYSVGVNVPDDFYDCNAA